MPLRPPNAPPPILRLRGPQKPPQQCQRHRLPAHRPKSVRLSQPHTLSPSNPLRVRDSDANLSPPPSPATPSATFDRPNRLKAREESIIKWADLLDKFKTVQEKARRGQRVLQNRLLDEGDARQGADPTTVQDDIRSAGAGETTGRKDSKPLLSDLPRQQALRPMSAGSVGQSASQMPSRQGQGQGQGMGKGHKPKSSLGNLGRLAGVSVGGPMRKMKR